jgi:hypothetical protein
VEGKIRIIIVLDYLSLMNRPGPERGCYQKQAHSSVSVCGRRAFPEDCAANSQHGRALLDGQLEVIAHAHGQFGKVFPSQALAALFG